MPDSVKAITFAHRFLQPMDGPDQDRNTEAAVRLLQKPPRMAPVAANT